MARPLKVLFFDIETAPLLAHVWTAKVEYVPSDMFVHDSFMLSWAAKWKGSPKVLSDVLTPDEARAQNDKRIVESLASVVREADLLIAHNIDRFDVPMLNNRLLGMKLEPVGPVRTLDTLTLARKAFRLASNKLDYLLRFLGLPRKLKTDFELWRLAYMGDKKALSYMQEYNEHDVVSLEKALDRMMPYLRNAPRFFEAEREGERACPYCGSDKMTPRKYYRTQASTFTQYQCGNCLKYSRARTTERSKKLGVHPL